MRLFARTLLIILLISGMPPTGHGDTGRYRTPLEIPDIPGFLTLKCDFHMHTVFSDGDVWPDVRAEEAWREGLDAIAITDHIEYQPHREDVPADLVLHAGKVSLVQVRAGHGMPEGRFEQRPLYEVTNLLVRPGEGLRVELPFVIEREE